MSLNPISTLNTINEITSSEDVLMIMDASDTETKQILISEFNTYYTINNLNPFWIIFRELSRVMGRGLTGVESGEWDGSHLGDASITGSFTVSGSGTHWLIFLDVEGWSSQVHFSGVLFAGQF